MANRREEPQSPTTGSCSAGAHPPWLGTWEGRLRPSELDGEARDTLCLSSVCPPQRGDRVGRQPPMF